MSGGAFRRAGAAVVLVAAVGAGLTGCAGSKIVAGASVAATSAAPVMTTEAAAVSTTAMATTPAVVATTPSPRDSTCLDTPGTERIAMRSTTTVDGNFALVGFKEIMICGPGVPDDIEYEDTGSLTTFVIPADAKVTLLGTSASTLYQASVTELANLIAKHSAPGAPYVLWSNFFELTLDSNGRITGVDSLYHP